MLEADQEAFLQHDTITVTIVPKNFLYGPSKDNKTKLPPPLQYLIKTKQSVKKTFMKNHCLKLNLLQCLNI